MAEPRPQNVFGACIAIVVTCLAVFLWSNFLNGRGSNITRTSNTAYALTGGGSSAVGHDVILATGCGSCHEIPGIPGAHGKIGPSLDDFKDRAMIGGVLSNSADNLVRWLQDPRAVDPKTAMPNLGLTEQQARDLAAYLYSGGGTVY